MVSSRPNRGPRRRRAEVVTTWRRPSRLGDIDCSKCGRIASLIEPTLAKQLADDHWESHNGPKPGRRR